MAADDVEHAGDLGTVVKLAVGDVVLVVDAEDASEVEVAPAVLRFNRSSALKNYNFFAFFVRERSSVGTINSQHDG